MTDGVGLHHEAVEPIPAGETLAEWLDRVDMSQAEFAKRTSLTPKHINQVVKGGAGISPEVALAFERVTAIPSRYWLQLDANFHAAVQRIADSQELATRLDIIDRFPIKELTKRHAISPTKTPTDTLRELLRFFAVADVNALESVWLQPALYRKSQAFEADAGALASWLRLAEIEASRVATAEFDPGQVRQAIDRMRELSVLPGIDWLIPLKRLCSSIGIALVILKEIPGCRINGATRWLAGDKALVALSLRHRRNDIFWFTLMHELCHVLRHGKKQTFVDTTDSALDQDLEAEADAFASRVLIPPNQASRIPALRTIDDVIAFANEIGVAPGIVVGRMQHDGLIAHSQWNSLIQRYTFTDD